MNIVVILLLTIICIIYLILLGASKFKSIEERTLEDIEQIKFLNNNKNKKGQN